MTESQRIRKLNKNQSILTKQTMCSPKLDILLWLQKHVTNSTHFKELAEISTWPSIFESGLRHYRKLLCKNEEVFVRNLNILHSPQHCTYPCKWNNHVAAFGYFQVIDMSYTVLQRHTRPHIV